MAYMSAREMLSGLPVKMAEGGPVHMATGGLTPIASGDPLFDALQKASANAPANKTYGNFGATAQDLQKAAVNVRAQIADGSYDPAAGYAEIMKSGISVTDAIEAGIEPSLIDAIFTTPTALTPGQLSSQGQTSVIGSGTAFANALTQDNVDAALAKYMLDGKIDPVERLEMQKVATAEGVTFQDMISFGIDPNILYKTPAPAGGGGTPVDTTPAGGGGTAGGGTAGGGGTAAGGGGTAATTKICPAGTLLEGQEIGINQSCGLAPKTDDGDKSAFGPDGETDAEKAARIAAADAARLAASIAAFDNTQADYTAPTVYQPLPDNTSVYGAGEKSLDTTFRESAPRTEIIDAYGGLVNFDYSPGASLTSATGSGYNFTPPTVTSRPRSLMGANQLGRYTGGRSAADLRQLTTGLGNGRTYSDYAGVLQNPGSYSGGLSKSQLYSRMRGLDYQRDSAAAADREASTARGGISAYLAANPDIAASYASQKGQLGGQSLEQFARNHYNTMGKAEMAANKRGDFILVESTGGGGVTIGDPNDGGGSYFSAGMGGFEGEGEDYETSNFTRAMDLGEAGGVTRSFAHGGSVKRK
jgi:hypothetical protein